MTLRTSHDKSVAFGAIFVLVLCSNVGQAQLIPIFDWVMSFFGSYEEPPFFLVRNITEVNLDDMSNQYYIVNKYKVCVYPFRMEIKQNDA